MSQLRLKNRELLGRGVGGDGGFVSKTEHRGPLTICDVQHPDLATVRQGRLDRSNSSRLAGYGRRISHIHAVLRHPKSFVKKKMTETCCFASLLYSQDRQVKHDDAPHRIIRHRQLSLGPSRKGRSSGFDLPRSTGPNAEQDVPVRWEDLHL